MTPLTPAQQALAAGQLRMARELAAIAGKGRPELAEDLESDACLSLVEAARAFRGDRGCRFQSFAYRAIAWRLRNLERHERPKGYRRRSEAPRVFSLADCRAEAEAAFASDPPGGEVEASEEFERLIANLPERFRDVLRLVFVDGLSQVAIAERLGISRETVRRLYVKAAQALGATDTRFPARMNGPSSKGLKERPC
jgi:RNA polymerase sigma factor (sigma-70 family)